MDLKPQTGVPVALEMDVLRIRDCDGYHKMFAIKNQITLNCFVKANMPFFVFHLHSIVIVAKSLL